MRLFAILTLGFTVLAALAVRETCEAAPLNFVFFLVDDLGRQDLSCEGSSFYETPNVDRIARSGMRFSNGYSACQVCSPSRAAIQVGKYPARVKITDYISPRGLNLPDKWKRNTPLLPAEYELQLPLAETTIAEVLKQAGYRTFFAGKWHLGGVGFTPREQGYEINKGGHEYGTPPGGYFSPYRNPALEDGPVGEELPQRLGRETAKFVAEQKDSPFFAMLSFYSVHGPIQCSEKRWRKYRDKAERLGLGQRDEARFRMDRAKEVRQVQDHPVYAGMMEAMDDAVGLVLDALEENGLAENTVVVFTSDNGGVSSGDGYSTSCLPFRGGKGRQWEGGIRQPLYIHWPGVTRGTTTHVPAVGTDFFPTLLEIAGLVPVLRGGTLPQRSLYWHYPHYGNQGGDPSAILMRGPWKLIHYFDGARNELYHVERDLGEQRDLAKEDPGRVESMAKELFAWMADVGARKPSTNPKYDSEKYARDLRKVQEVGVPKREEQHAAFLERHFVPRNGWWELRGGRKK